MLLPVAAVADLRHQLRERPGASLTVDLPAQTVITPEGFTVRFEIDGFRKQLLLVSRDELDLTLGYGAQNSEFEERQRSAMPWLSERYRV